MDKKLRLGIDLDDTVWVTMKRFIDYYNLKNGTDCDIGDCESYHIKDIFGISREEERSFFDDYNKGPFSKELVLLDGFLEVFEKLRDRFEVFFITARPKPAQELIFYRMKEVFGDEHKFPIHYCAGMGEGDYTPKVDICEELGIDVMIDDGLHHLRECSEKGIKCLLLDYPWNRAEGLGENIVRVDSWEDILEELEDVLG